VEQRHSVTMKDQHKYSRRSRLDTHREDMNVPNPHNHQTTHGSANLSVASLSITAFALLAFLLHSWSLVRHVIIHRVTLTSWKHPF
jgi:hypothetical protein